MAITILMVRFWREFVMTEKRKYPRFPCNIKADFDYYEGNPEEIDIETTVPLKGKGTILDISKGGLFLISNSRVGVCLPIVVRFTTKKNKYQLKGTIIRTGLVKNNPSEIAQKFASLDAKGDSYIAVEFDELFESLDASEL